MLFCNGFAFWFWIRTRLLRRGILRFASLGDMLALQPPSPVVVVRCRHPHMSKSKSPSPNLIFLSFFQKILPFFAPFQPFVAIHCGRHFRCYPPLPLSFITHPTLGVIPSGFWGRTQLGVLQLRLCVGVHLDDFIMILVERDSWVENVAAIPSNLSSSHGRGSTPTRTTRGGERRRRVLLLFRIKLGIER
ncbi:hypothetical protein B0H12DRAFT_1276192, partial [Mycena haematopus]